MRIVPDQKIGRKFENNVESGVTRVTLHGYIAVAKELTKKGFGVGVGKWARRALPEIAYSGGRSLREQARYGAAFSDSQAT